MAARLPSLPPMPSLDPTLARHERAALCDLPSRPVPRRPTLCGDWDVKDLVCHLLVRERSPIGGVRDRRSRRCPA